MEANTRAALKARYGVTWASPALRVNRKFPAARGSLKQLQCELMARAPASELSQHEPFLSAALMAAQATAADQGFRQRDVRFFVELFANWLSPAPSEPVLVVHNTQILRRLVALQALGWVKRVGRTPPRFQLRPEGLLGLLRRVSAADDARGMDGFFFVHHFLDAYGEKLRSLSQRERYTSAQLSAELTELTSPERLVQRERARVERAAARLLARVEDARSISQLARAELQKRVPLPQIVAQVEARFPYELNHQRPLRELLDAMPEPWRRQELTDTAERRASSLWLAQRTLLLAYDQVLKSLSPSSARR